MSRPRSWEEACQIIDAQTPMLENVNEWEASIKREFIRYMNRYSFMNGNTLRDYYHYHTTCQNQAKQKTMADQQPTAQELWDAVDALDPSGARPKGRNNFRELIGSELFDLIPLGKVYGTDMLWLIPGFGALPDSKVEGPQPTLGFADTDCGAILQPDGHPLEGELRLKVLTDEDEETLRRWVCLGWIAQRDQEQWLKTGHALAVDMEPGRKRNPWIVLASFWPNDGEPTWDGECEVYAEGKVDRNDEDQPGVLPGDRNRTPVEKIVNQSVKVSMLRAFGLDFEFDVLRQGSARGYIQSHRGPGLAHIMNLY